MSAAELHFFRTQLAANPCVLFVVGFSSEREREHVDCTKKCSSFRTAMKKGGRKKEGIVVNRIECAKADVGIDGILYSVTRFAI